MPANKTIDAPDDLLAAIDYCYEQGWTDGLPVVPPEQSRVEAMCAMEGRPQETVIANHPATGLELTIQALGANAVMAGCLPEYFPVLVAAFEAMNRERLIFMAVLRVQEAHRHYLSLVVPWLTRLA